MARNMKPDTTQLVSYNNSGTQCIRGFTNQTGYVKGNGNGNINLDDLGITSFPRSQSVAHNIAPRSGETRFFSYRNSGYQYIHGVTNQTGFVKGNGNGIINIKNQRHREVDVTAKLNALLNLVARECHRGDGTRTQPNSSSTTLRGENHQPHNFSNTGKQTIEGLTNQTGIIDGHSNGVVNI
ncbi:hypothetical protein L6164_026271 [Bauhinia variegata]|uniref:Uncharacterized protein n=2 Tax=Bauhinia variegata TaxID=167791 RepID=A0ACB9LQD8_BAUVA|nr:hypothetical protein L6164_026269 [Bauhinia variegata]KAI4313280.1 hypothetical protein L6164_026271 [Bauhinia variegata]